MFACRASLPWLALVLTVPAQDPAPAPATPEERALRRATDDLRAACADLLAGPVAFTGTVRTGAPDRAEPIDDRTIPFRGAFRDGVQFAEIGRHRLLLHTDRLLVRTGDGPWTLPQGDQADLPLSPRALATHAPHATTTLAEPAFVDGRPQLRVHANWQGAAAADLLRLASHPDAKLQRVLEILPELVGADREGRTRVEAVFRLDPANRRLLGVTLRAALLTDEDRPAADTDEAPDPDGLPRLPRVASLICRYELTIVPADEVPFPALDAALRERLALPEPAVK